MTGIDPSKDLLFMVVYNVIDEIDIGYMAAELRPGIFPGKIDDRIVKDELVIDAINVKDNMTVAQVLNTCNEITKKVREKYRETFVILLGKYIKNWTIIVEFSAYKVISIDAVLF